MRMTSQRALILDFLKGVKTHPTALEIYKAIRVKLPNISFGTVYRNLNFLKEKGLIQELKMAAISRFDGNIENHYHFRCRLCGKVEDIEMPVTESLINIAQKRTNSLIESHEIQFTGTCSQCKKGRKNENN